MDRRIKKSQIAIESALIELMKEKDFEEITINSIAEKANVSRGTIYLNYEDKYHILEKCIDEELHKLMESCIPNENDNNNLNVQTLLLRTLEYIDANSNIFITLLENKGVQTFRDRLLSMVRDRMFSQLNLTGINKGMNREIFIQFWSVAIIGMIEWWVKNSIPYSSEEIMEHLFHLLSRNEVIPLINE
ncbi:TetR/AcrR family transcriptional regulator [Peribacillus frigoritolerans]